MAFHLAAWSESVDQAAIASIAAVNDPVLTVSGDNIQVPTFGNYLMGAAGIGVNLTRAQLQSPSLRRILNPEINPIRVAAAPAGDDGILDLFGNPVQLDVSEQMQAFAAEDAAGASRMNILAWLGDGKVDTITDPIFTIRATGAAALTAFAWTNLPIVFDQVLPVGTYGIVGARYTGATAIAFRFVFQGSTPRPGGIGQTALSNIDVKGQRFGKWGLWGTFESVAQPTVDCFAGAADAAEVFAIDLIKLG